jgi:hypothetical protein
VFALLYQRPSQVGHEAPALPPQGHRRRVLDGVGLLRRLAGLAPTRFKILLAYSSETLNFGPEPAKSAEAGKP